MENIENKEEVKDTVSAPDTVSAHCVEREDGTPFLTVYKKKSTFKGATDEDFWYSGTLSNKQSVKCVFKCEVPTKSMAFEISNVVGNMKDKTVVVKGETYTNSSYYISSCNFHEIKGEPLPL